MRTIRWWHAYVGPSVIDMTAVAVLGMGTMGRSIALRLLAAGHDVTVWNRSQVRTEPVVAAGAKAADTPAEAVRDAEIVITMLTDAGAVEAVVLGPDGAAGAMPAGACLVEMSTIGPAAVRDLADRLPSDIDLVDAPVGGSVAAVEAGTLRVFAGGDPVDVERVAPVLGALGTVRRCGPSGTGAALKLVLNTALVTGISAVADTLAVARAVGVDRDIALDLLASGPLGIAVERATATGSYFAIALAAKDLDLALEALGDTHAPVARAAADTLRHASDQSADLGTIVTKGPS
jgi:3-hydroxyisobutyrate dehydrogenase